MQSANLGGRGDCERIARGDGDPWMNAERFDAIVLNDRIISGAMILIRTRSNVSSLKRVNYYLIITENISV